MANNLHTLDDALAELEKISIPTTNGTFVKMEDVRRLMKLDQEQAAIEEKAAPKPKTFAEAKEAIKGNSELMEKLGGAKPSAGRSIPAAPQPVSRP